MVDIILRWRHLLYRCHRYTEIPAIRKQEVEGGEEKPVGAVVEAQREDQGDAAPSGQERSAEEGEETAVDTTEKESKAEGVKTGESVDSEARKEDGGAGTEEEKDKDNSELVKKENVPMVEAADPQGDGVEKGKEPSESSEEVGGNEAAVMEKTAKTEESSSLETPDSMPSMTSSETRKESPSSEEEGEEVVVKKEGSQHRESESKGEEEEEVSCRIYGIQLFH